MLDTNKGSLTFGSWLFQEEIDENKRKKSVTLKYELERFHITHETITYLLTEQEVCMGESWPRSDRTQCGMYTRPRSRFFHTD